MTLARSALAAVAVVVSLALQISLMPHVAWHGIVPNLVLLVVVSAALTCSPRFALGLGFAAGVLMDVVPPADHYVGRWALALVLVAWFASTARQGSRPSVLQVLGTVAASSFVGTSIFAISGLLLRDPVVEVGDMLTVVLVGVVWDLVMTPFVVPVTMKLFRRLGPDTERERP